MDIENALNFRGKTVLVTGASDGIGYGIAQAYKRAGANVTVTGTKTAENYDQDFSGLTFLQLNVVEPESVEAMAKKIDKLDILVNCVGTVLYKSKEFERESFDLVVNVNLTGIMHVCTELKDKLAESKGNIVNLDSVVAIQPARNNPAYSASKAGLKHLNKVLAWKWGKEGIRVNGISPGYVPTKITANQRNDDDSQQALAAKLPVGRLGSPEDMAGAVMFLCSPLAAYVTGVSFCVDGGLTLLSQF